MLHLKMYSVLTAKQSITDSLTVGISLQNGLICLIPDIIMHQRVEFLCEEIIHTVASKVLDIIRNLLQYLALC